MDQILKKALRARGLSQKEFAELIHVTPQAVSKWLNGESRPSQDNVILIFETLGIDLTKEMVLQNSRCRKKGMEMTELQEIDSFEKAKKESAHILEKAGIKHKYSYPVYTLLSWLLPAVIGLTYHQSLHAKDDDETDCGFIACNLKDYNPCCMSILQRFQFCALRGCQTALTESQSMKSRGLPEYETLSNHHHARPCFEACLLFCKPTTIPHLSFQ